MKVFYIGDVYGRAGRATIRTYLPKIKEQYKPDIILANVDNAAHGLGVTGKILDELLSLGVQGFCGGDHSFHQRDFRDEIINYPMFVRPLNMSDRLPGIGMTIIKGPAQRKIALIHLVGQMYMNNMCDNPFTVIEEFLKKNQLGIQVNTIILDFHAELTSEKVAMGRFCDGMVSAVLGTHTHIPTADAMILPHGTAYITDVGMTGDYDSIIGARKEEPIATFRQSVGLERRQPADGEGTLSGVLIQLDSDGHFATSIQAIQMGGFWDQCVHQSYPQQ